MKYTTTERYTSRDGAQNEYAQTWDNYNDAHTDFKDRVKDMFVHTLISNSVTITLAETDTNIVVKQITCGIINRV